MSTIALGWDIHRKFSRVSVFEITEDSEMQVRERRRLDHEDRAAMRSWLGQLPRGTPVAMEAAFGWPWIADLLEEFDLEPHLAHPPATWVFAKHQERGNRLAE